MNLWKELNYFLRSNCFLFSFIPSNICWAVNCGPWMIPGAWNIAGVLDGVLTTEFEGPVPWLEARYFYYHSVLSQTPYQLLILIQICLLTKPKTRKINDLSKSHGGNNKNNQWRQREKVGNWWNEIWDYFKAYTIDRGEIENLFFILFGEECGSLELWILIQ